jgi:hypothetical protein
MYLPANDVAFLKTLKNADLNNAWPETLQSLWYDAKGNWKASHNIAQHVHNKMGSSIHAYLHHKEGDEFNTGYCYRQAGKTFPKISLEEKHREMTEYVLLLD